MCCLFVKHRYNHVFWVKSADGSYKHVEKDNKSLTSEQVTAHAKRLKQNCLQSCQDNLEAGQVVCKSLGRNVQLQIVDGVTTNPTATEVFFYMCQVIGHDKPMAMQNCQEAL